MCQLQTHFHRPCAHWAPRPSFLGEPCVRARRVAIHHDTSNPNTPAITYITIPCDFPDSLGAVDVPTECPSCEQRHRREIEEALALALALGGSDDDEQAEVEDGGSGSWRPFAGLSEAGWEAVRDAQRRRRRRRRRARRREAG